MFNNCLHVFIWVTPQLLSEQSLLSRVITVLHKIGTSQIVLSFGKDVGVPAKYVSQGVATSKVDGRIQALQQRLKVMCYIDRHRIDGVR